MGKEEEEFMALGLVGDVAALDAKNTKELADAKAENDALRDDVAAGRRQFAHESSLSVSA